MAKQRREVWRKGKRALEKRKRKARKKEKKEKAALPALKRATLLLARYRAPKLPLG
jgi:hypothetical protein